MAPAVNAQRQEALKAESAAKSHQQKLATAALMAPIVGPAMFSLMSPDAATSTVRDSMMGLFDAPSQAVVDAANIGRGDVLLSPEMRHRMLQQGRDPNEVAQVPRQGEDGLDVYDSPVSAAYKVGRDVVGGHFNESDVQRRHRFLAEQAGMDPALMGERSAALQAGAVPAGGRRMAPVDLAGRVQEMLSSEAAKREASPALQAIQGSEVTPPNVYTALTEAGVDPVNAGLAYLASDAWNVAFEAPGIARAAQRGLTGLASRTLAQDAMRHPLPSSDAADAAIRGIQGQRDETLAAQRDVQDWELAPQRTDAARQYGLARQRNRDMIVAERQKAAQEAMAQRHLAPSAHEAVQSVRSLPSVADINEIATETALAAVRRLPKLADVGAIEEAAVRAVRELPSVTSAPPEVVDSATQTALDAVRALPHIGAAEDAAVDAVRGIPKLITEDEAVASVRGLKPVPHNDRYRTSAPDPTGGPKPPAPTTNPREISSNPAPRLEELRAADAAEVEKAVQVAEAAPPTPFEPREFQMKRSYAEGIGAGKGDRLRLESIDGEDYVATLVRKDGSTDEFRIPRADMDDDLVNHPTLIREVKPKPVKPAEVVAPEPEPVRPDPDPVTPPPENLDATTQAASDAADANLDAARRALTEPTPPPSRTARNSIPDDVRASDARFVTVGTTEAGIGKAGRRYKAWDGEHVAVGNTPQEAANALSKARKRSATMGETRSPQLPGQATHVDNKPPAPTPGGDKNLVRDFINRKVDRGGAQNGPVRPGGKGVRPGTPDDAQFSYGAGGVHPVKPGQTTLHGIKDVQSPHESLRGIARKLTRLVFGEDKTLAASGAAGYYRKSANVAALRKAYNMPDGFHEMGHALDAKLKMQQRLTPTARQELHGLVQNAANYTPAQMGDEGLAEAVRLFIHDPAELMKKAPSVAHELEAAVQSDKAVASILGEAQHEVAKFRNTSPEGRIKAVTTPKAKYKARAGIVQKAAAAGDQAIEKVFDQLVHIERGEEKAGLIGPMKDSSYKQGRVFRAVANQALHTSLHGEGMPTIVRNAAGAIERKNQVIVVKGEKYRNLGDILQGFDGANAVDDFETYLVARRAQEIGPDKSPVDLHDADSAIRNMEAKYGREFIQDRAQAFYKWHDLVLQYAVDTGLVSEKSAASMRELYSNYVPFRRNNDIGIDEYAVEQFGETNRGLEAGKPSSLMRLTGSHREIVSPLQTSIANAHAIYINGEKNLVGQTMARNIDRLGPRSGEALGTNVTVRKLQNIGGKTISVTAAPSDAQNVVKVLIDGKAEYYKLRPEVYSSWKHISSDELGMLGKMLQPASKVVRFGVTNNPKFIYNEFIRNPMEYAIVSESIKTPIALPILNEPFVRGVASYLMAGLEHSGANRTAAGKVANHILSYLGSADGVKLYKQYGGKAGMNAALGDEAHYASELSAITKGLTPQELEKTWLPKGVAAKVKVVRQKIGIKRRYQAFKEASEDVARVGVFEAKKRQELKAGKSLAEADAEAAFEARDVLDFSQKGSAMKELSAIQAFTRPKLTGTHRFYRALKRDPVGTLIKSISTLTIPTLMVYAKHRHDAAYQEIPDAEKRYFWHWRYGSGPKDFFRMAKPPGIATVYFDELVQRALAHADQQDPKAFDGVIDSLLESQTPFQTKFPFMKLGSLVDAGQILEMNYDPFFKGPVLAPYEQNKLPSSVVSDKTPMLSKKLAALPGDIAERGGGDRRKYDMAPKAVDRAVQAVAPGLIYDVYRRVGGKPAGAPNLLSTDTLGLTKHDFSSQTLNNLYKRQEFLRKADESESLRDGEAQELQDIEAAMDTVRDLKEDLKTATDKTQRDQIVTRIFEAVAPFRHKVK